MELGIVVPNSGRLATAQAIYRIAEHAEALGFAAVWTADHLVLPVATSASYPYTRARGVSLDPDWPFLEPLVALAAIAARTRRIGLGVSVYLAALRHPIVTAKLVASLDQLSGGRVLLGVGAGWIPEEYAALGIGWSERGRVLDEHLECLRALWTAERPAHAGPRYAFEGIGFAPKPVRGRVPIWIGGNSRPALRRAARLGDGWHAIDLGPAELRPRLAELDALCARHGRRRDELVVSMRAQISLTERPVPRAERPGPLCGPLDEVVADLRELRTLGVGHLALWPSAREIDLDTTLARMDEIATRIAPALAAS
jgi:probable F420-dependent oxidoreductase